MLAQVVTTAVLAPIILVLVAKRHSDLAWLVGGALTLWIALIGFRALH